MAMSELKQKLLLNELAKAEFMNAVYEPQNDVIRIQTDNDGGSILISDDYEVRFLQANRETALFTVKPLVDKVTEIISAWENANAVPFENLTHYRTFAEYNRVIMAARDDTEYGRGLYFVTWQYNYDRTGVENGYYTEDYDDVKENFAQRSGLVPKEKLFTQEQAAEIKTVIENLFENDYDLYLSYEKTEMLNSIIEQINDAYPEKAIKDEEKQSKETALATHNEEQINVEDIDYDIDEMTIQDVLCEKICAEHKQFLNELKELSPDMIIEKSYEIAIKDDLVTCICDMIISDGGTESLLSLNNTLEDLYDAWLETDVSNKDMLRDCVYSKIDSLQETLGEYKTTINEKNINAENTKIDSINIGDLVFSTPESKYGYECLVGKVIDIIPHELKDHGTIVYPNEIHVDFFAPYSVLYSDNRKDEIVKRFSVIIDMPNEYDKLPLGDVIMPPENLVKLNGKTDSWEMQKILSSYKEAESFYQSHLSEQRNTLHSELMGCINKNYSDYTESLSGFGQNELIDMAARITAMSETHDYLTTQHYFNTEEIEFLLQFENPLEILADSVCDRRSDYDDVGFAIEFVKEHKESILESYPLLNGAGIAELTNTQTEQSVETSDFTVLDDKSVKPNNFSDKTADKPKTLEEKLNAAKKKVKTQDAQNNDKKPKNREERD